MTATPRHFGPSLVGNILHRLGDALEIAKARVRFVVAVLAGRYPLPTPMQEANMAAIDDLKAAAQAVATYVASLQGDLANADQTSEIEAVTASLQAIIPAAPVAPVEPVAVVEPVPAPVPEPVDGQVG